MREAIFLTCQYLKDVLSYFKQNGVAQDETVCQKNITLNLINDAITRRNSNLDNLLQNPKASVMLTGTEVAVLKEIINISTPIEMIPIIYYD